MYIYDPVGNIVRVEDAALATVYHGNHRINPYLIVQYTVTPSIA